MDNFLSQPKIRVVVRKRPISQKEIDSNDSDVIQKRENQTIIVSEIKYNLKRTKLDLSKYIEEHSFIFDDVFDENVSNQELYISAVQPLIESALNGTRVTCFAYGQTGSGKTYTMMGMQKADKLIPGLFLLATEEIFYKIAEVYINSET